MKIWAYITFVWGKENVIIFKLRNKKKILATRSNQLNNTHKKTKKSGLTHVLMETKER